MYTEIYSLNEFLLPQRVMHKHKKIEIMYILLVETEKKRNLKSSPDEIANVFSIFIFIITLCEENK